MQALRELMAQNPPLSLALGGLAVGLAFGWIVFRTNFCTMGAVSDMLAFGDRRRFRSWIMAAAVALIGTQLLARAGAVELGKSMYLAPSFDWLGHVLGGLMFGFGMVFAGGCGSRNLVRAGGGDLRSLLVLVVLGIFAYTAIGGLLGPLRAELTRLTALDLGGAKLATQGIGLLASRLTGFPAGAADLLIAGLIGLAALAWCFKDKGFRSSPVHIIAGLGVGLCVVAGWAVTGLAFDEMAERAQAPISLTYVRPTGDTLEWLQRFTAARMPGFGVASVIGALLGSFLAAWGSGRFQLASFADKGDTVRNLAGAALMGVGGVMALGCTIGQAVTGVSTLALGSFVTFAAIVAGAVLGIRALERILMGE
jgi:hypothetical protein